MPHASSLSRRLAITTVVLVASASCYVLADWWTCLPAGTQATYVGGSTCAECHQVQAQQWSGSDHDLAMDRATSESVLGDFGGVELEHFGVTSRMFQRDGKFFVNTEGPDGKMADFEVKYVFGVEPLQQYMVEFDRPAHMPEREIARLQVLRVSWDTQQKKWFYLSPPDVDERLAPDDPLHWTRAGQNWNHMCAQCHSTNLRKGYDVATGRYHTTFSEIDVSCETCHGPGSVHVQLARGKSLFWDRTLGYGLAKQLKSEDPRVEIQTCAACHSRRQSFYPDDPPGQSYYDCFANEVLMPSTYYPDGQVLDEVYVYGSFLQSKMYHEGVRCTDCHDPHTTRVKFDGNNLCTSCHTKHPAAKYDTPAHHRHAASSVAAQCVECHMPSTPFMDIDFRRDHSLRVPRPDLSVELGTPNACTGCHLKPENVDPDRRARLKHYSDWLLAAREGDTQVQAEIDRVNLWAANTVKTWYGEKERPRHFAHTLAAAWQHDPQAVPDLLELARNRREPAIVRASALVQLAQLAPAESWETSRRLLKDSDPQVRSAAIGCLETLPEMERLKTLTPMLEDSVRLVRGEAARALAHYGPMAFDARHLELRDRALEEYRRGLREHADQASAHTGLALIADSQGDLAAAAEAYRTGIRTQPDVTGPRSNLAELLERSGDTRQAAEAVRLRREELNLLARDARLAPQSAVIQYRYGLSLYLHGQHEEAESSLREACRLEPRVADYRLALTLLYQRLEKWSDALASASELCRLQPQNGSLQQLLGEIQAQAAAAGPNR